jgi:hypothetical protein
MKNTGLIPVSVLAGDDLVGSLTDILKKFHTSQARAVVSATLAHEIFGLFVPKDAERTIRDAVEKIIEQGGLVCSSPACGYWWAESLDDGMPAAQKKLHRAQVQLVNAKKLEHNLMNSFPTQPGGPQ